MFVPTNLPMTKRKCTEFYKALPQDLICLALSFLQNIIAVSKKKGSFVNDGGCLHPRIGHSDCKNYDLDSLDAKMYKKNRQI